MRYLPGGVCVITAGRAPARTGYTGTAIFSVSADPERIVISLHRTSSSFAPIRDLCDFGLNILNSDQQGVADRFAGRGVAKGEARFEGAQWRVTPTGVSLLVGAVASLECRVEEVILRHSHVLIIAEPTWIETDATAEALFYWRAQYLATRSYPRLAAE